MSDKITVHKRMTFPQLGSESWSLHLFEYLISCLVGQGLSGAVYGELCGSVRSVEIKFCSERELMLTKRNKSEVVGCLDLGKFTRFVSFIIRDVLRVESGAVAAGVVDVDFVGEGERHFAIAVRRSSSLGSYFQIDQFAVHL